MKKYHYQTIRSKARLRSELMQTRSRAEVKRKDDRLSSIADSLQGLQLEVLRPGTGLQDMMAEQVTILNGHTAILETPSKLLERLTPDDESKSGLANQLQGKVPLLNAAGTDFADPELKEQLRGLPGPQGERGLQGLQGVQGLKGDTGAAGKDGADGKTWKPSVAADGTLSWSTATGEPASANIRGPQGVQGIQGPAGKDGKDGTEITKNDIIGKLGDYYTTPAKVKESVDSISIGGRNLLLDSGVKTTNSDYLIREYSITEQIKAGDEVTISIKATLGANKTGIGVYNSGGIVLVAEFDKNDIQSDGVYRKTVKWRTSWSGTEVDTKTMRVYMYRSATVEESTVEWVKLEYGNKATSWTPAPEDVDKNIQDIRTIADSALPRAQVGDELVKQIAIQDGRWVIHGEDKGQATGNDGERGLQGVQGLKGDKGDTGADGKTWKPAVAADGTLTWTAASGTPAPANIRGPQGVQGAQGVQGYSIVTSVSRPAFTEANWATYGEVGHEGNWSNTEAIRNGCRVGDIFTVVGTATDSGKAHVLYYRSDTASGNLRGVCISHSIANSGNDGKTWKPSVDASGNLTWTTATGTPASANIRGPQGLNGNDGKDGADGKTWKPSVAADGTLTWTTATGTPASVNIKGQPGRNAGDFVYVTNAIASKYYTGQTSGGGSRVADIKGIVSECGRYLTWDAGVYDYTFGNLDIGEEVVMQFKSRNRTYDNRLYMRFGVNESYTSITQGYFSPSHEYKYTFKKRVPILQSNACGLEGIYIDADQINC